MFNDINGFEHKTLQLLNVEITSFKELVPFLIPLVILPIGTTTRGIRNVTGLEFPL